MRTSPVQFMDIAFRVIDKHYEQKGEGKKRVSSVDRGRMALKFLEMNNSQQKFKYLKKFAENHD